MIVRCRVKLMYDVHFRCTFQTCFQFIPLYHLHCVCQQSYFVITQFVLFSFIVCSHQYTVFYYGAINVELRSSSLATLQLQQVSKKVCEIMICPSCTFIYYLRCTVSTIRGSGAWQRVCSMDTVKQMMLWCDFKKKEIYVQYTVSLHSAMLCNLVSPAGSSLPL